MLLIQSSLFFSFLLLLAGGGGGELRWLPLHLSSLWHIGKVRSQTSGMCGEAKKSVGLSREQHTRPSGRPGGVPATFIRRNNWSATRGKHLGNVAVISARRKDDPSRCIMQFLETNEPHGEIRSLWLKVQRQLVSSFKYDLFNDVFINGKIELNTFFNYD